MFYVCVVCMVSVKGNPLIRLTGEQLQLWELIISPRINITKIRKCLLLVCPECNQLLFTMLEFQRTMHVGAKNLLFLYRNLRIKNQNQVSSLEQEREPCHELPTVIGAQSDKWLPVANEEVVLSEPWTAVEAAAPVSKPTKLPPALRYRIVKQRAVHVSEHNVDYAVLIPINDETNLLCEENVADSSELSETSKIEESMPILEDAKDESLKEEFSNVGNSSIVRKLKKIKLNRQLFDAIRVTLKSPSLTEEFDIKYKPESESESGGKSGPELARESAPESERKLERVLERHSGLDLERESVHKWALEWAREVKRKSGLESERKLGLESALESERKLKHELERKSALESGRKLKRELERKSGLESERKFGLETAFESERKLKRELERKSVLGSERKLKRELELKSGLDLERKSVLESERKSVLELALELARESGLETERELDPNSESTLSCESDYEDPENFPNIIFAKAFNGVGDMEDTYIQDKGEESVQQIHCHLVSNPPSEWPCSDEQCRLQSWWEDEDSKTPSDSPRDSPIVRSKKTVVPGRPRCKLCGRSFAKISMLWQHFERSHMDAALKCDVCRKEFRNETELRFHKMKHQFKKTVEYQFEAPSRHMCVECAVRCSSARLLRAHRATRRHAAKLLWRFQCDICKRKCPDKKRMAEHIQREHLAKEAVKCSMCPASFRSARTLRRHVAQHMLESQTQKNKTDTQKGRKRARDTQTKGHENTDPDILRNGEDKQVDIQTNGQRKRAHYNSQKTSSAGHMPPPKSATVTGPALDSSGPLPGHQSTLTTTRRPRKTTNNVEYPHTDRRRNTHADTIIKEHDYLEIQTNGQTSKKPRKVTHKKVNAYTYSQGNRLADTYINAQDDIEMQINGQTRKKPRKVTHKKESTYTYSQGNRLADTYINAQDDMDIQANGQTRKKPRKTTNNSQANTFTNKQETMPTYTYAYRQEDTHKETRENTRRKTHTGTQETTPTAADNITHTHTNGRVRKRRKRRPYVTSKRARTLAKAAADRERGAVAKTSLFDMISSFIL